MRSTGYGEVTVGDANAPGAKQNPKVERMCHQIPRCTEGKMEQHQDELEISDQSSCRSFK